MPFVVTLLRFVLPSISSKIAFSFYRILVSIEAFLFSSPSLASNASTKAYAIKLIAYPAVSFLMLDHIIQSPIGIFHCSFGHNSGMLIKFGLLTVLVYETVLFPIRVLEEHLFLVCRDDFGEHFCYIISK